jgi:CheY-like chemotaxis protein
MVYGFVKQSGGHVKIESAPNRGTRVKAVSCRAATRQFSRDAWRAAESADVSGRDRTILLVEDDAGVRAVTAAMLKELQFTVIEADNGSHALDIVDRQPDIDLLFTDIVMPGMNGFELGRLARERGRSCRCCMRRAMRRRTPRRRRARMCGEAVSGSGSADEAERFADRPSAESG